MTGKDWDQIFRNWSAPSSDTEETKCHNAERMIRDAIRESSVLSARNIEVFAQGSYRNNTNVRLSSDVDVCVRCMDVLFDDYSMSNGLTRQDVGITDVGYTYGQFKNEVEAALVSKFGRPSVTRGNKAFDVHANSYRVDADVVACFEHRRYLRGAYGGFYYLSGTEFISDMGQRIINWPHQHYDNGVSKNRATGTRFKSIVRVIKRLRNEMDENGMAAARPISSYLIECAVYNVPNNTFGHYLYKDDVRDAIIHLYNQTLSDEGCRGWIEVNDLKYLFGPHQSWTRQQVNEFVLAAWRYVGFE